MIKNCRDLSYNDLKGEAPFPEELPVTLEMLRIVGNPGVYQRI